MRNVYSIISLCHSGISIVFNFLINPRAEWNECFYSAVVHCLNGLGGVGKKQRKSSTVIYINTVQYALDQFDSMILFFSYAPLCMSLNDEVLKIFMERLKLMKGKQAARNHI